MADEADSHEALAQDGADSAALGDACPQAQQDEGLRRAEAVEQFQGAWNADVGARAFADMLERSLGRVADVPGLENRYFVKSIVVFARADPEKVRALFATLFDESQDVDARAEVFRRGADELLAQYGNGAVQHYQDADAIGTYLWLRYPDAYGPCGSSSGDASADGVLEDGALAGSFDEGEGGVDVASGDAAGADLGSGADSGSGAAGDAAPDVYTKARFLEEVYMGGEGYERLTALLAHRKNLILQGAPGVGKTFCAERLTWSLMGCRDAERIAFVQFHQSYSYEDFVMGYRPSGEGFELRPGTFYRFCRKAAARPDEDFFFIIDEINRGNLSRIFGELLMLVERDYRGHEIALAYGGQPFCVPENVYLLGMMNMADRSLAMIDYALRRRFAFFTMEPAFDSVGFVAYQRRLDDVLFDALVAKLRDLNVEIAADSSLGPGFRIGHSYLCGFEDGDEGRLHERLREVVDYDIVPMLSEYWFDDEARRSFWEGELRGIFR